MQFNPVYVNAAEYQEMLRYPSTAPACADGTSAIVVDLNGMQLRGQVALPHTVTIGVNGSSDSVDLVANSQSVLDDLIAQVHKAPEAAALLMQVLRHNTTASIREGLLVESLAYSTLQHGYTFTQWLSTHTPSDWSPADAAADVVQTIRQDNVLTITLNRPEKHNALNHQMRSELLEALEVATLDPSVERVELQGAGPSFSSGGDLDEFGLARDATRAHLARMAQYAGEQLANLKCHTHAHLKGACMGAGIEIPAFASHITAAPDVQISLPEFGYGLIPGAGGTVSVLRRIGRQACAELALTGRIVGAEEAAAIGLIEQISD